MASIRFRRRAMNKRASTQRYRRKVFRRWESVRECEKLAAKSYRHAKNQAEKAALEARKALALVESTKRAHDRAEERRDYFRYKRQRLEDHMSCRDLLY
jgi:hypothetical protein